MGLYAKIQKTNIPEPALNEQEACCDILKNIATEDSKGLYKKALDSRENVSPKTPVSEDPSYLSILHSLPIIDGSICSLFISSPEGQNTFPKELIEKLDKQFILKPFSNRYLLFSGPLSADPETIWQHLAKHELNILGAQAWRYKKAIDTDREELAKTILDKANKKS
jgi:hypothetical protein